MADVAGTYAATVDDLSGTFVVVTEVISPPVSWWVALWVDWWVWIIIGLGATIIVGLIVWMVVRRRRD